MSKPSALIIEDDPDISLVFSKALESAGFGTEIINAGDIAMTRLSSVIPDIVTLDLNLPGVSGEEILRYIRSDVRMTDTKVIVASAYQHLTDALYADADLVLVKPVNFTQLRDLATRLVLSVPSSAQ
jgi:DNA-binding response OmpR family regulator